MSWTQKAEEFLDRKQLQIDNPTALVQLLFFYDLLPDNSQETLDKAYEIAEKYIKDASFSF